MAQAQSLKDLVLEGDVPWHVCLWICTWYSQLLGKTATDTARDFQQIFGVDAIKAVTVRSLFKQFREGRNKICDLLRSG